MDGVLSEKLTDPQPVKKYPARCGTGMFITVYTIALNLSLLWERTIQSMSLHPTS